jgi:hypothetical protein
MRCWTYLLIVVSIVLLVGCKDEVQVGDVDGSKDSANVVLHIPEETPLATRTPSPTPTDQALSLRSSIRQLSFGQSNATMGYTFRMLSSSELPNKPYSIVRHMEEFSIRVDLIDLDRIMKEQLLSQITIEGRTQTKLEIDERGAVLRFTEMDDAVTVTLGDIPPIRIVKAEPLQLTVDTSELKDESIVLEGIYDQNPVMRALLVSNRDTRITLIFSEDMDQSKSTGMPKGEWLDNRRYRLELEDHLQFGRHERVETGVGLMGFRSIRGNYTGAYDWDLSIRQVHAGEWRDIRTGERVGWSPRDSFYETIIHSPDRNNYVGTVAIGRPDGDGDGLYYALILEESGQAPVFIEKSIYLNILQQGSPVQWVDNNRILYADYARIYEYTISTGERRIVMNRENEEGGYHTVTFDRIAGQLHVMTQKYEETIDHTDRVVVNSFVYDGLEKPAIFEQLRTAVIRTSNGFMAYRMTVNPLQRGVFRTTTQEEGWPITIYESREGSKTVLPGQVHYADDKIVFLLEDHYFFQVGDQAYQKLWVWNYSDEGPIAAPLAPGFIRVAGNQPVAWKDTEYYQYDVQTNAWKRWETEQQILAISPQSSVGMYKVSLHRNDR